MGILSLVTGIPGPSGFGSASTAEQVSQGIDATNLTAIVTGLCFLFFFSFFFLENVLFDQECFNLGYINRLTTFCYVFLNSDFDLGGASGIGLETARVLVLRGARVIIAARNTEAANEAKQLILKDNEAAHVDVLKLDLCSMKSIREFVDNFNALDLPLNILIKSLANIFRNNAGVMFCPYQVSEDGVEVQFATNHLGHFLLTNLLLEKMKNTARVTGIGGRIVNLSSIAHLHTYEEGIRFDNINDEIGYSDKKAYGQSKLANILHASELSRRLQEEGANITVNSVHPGLIMTNLMRHSALLMRILQVFSYMFWKNVPQGAATTCYAALHPSLKGVTGKYFLDCNEMTPSVFASDEVLAKKLWDFSNKLVMLENGAKHCGKAMLQKPSASDPCSKGMRNYVTCHDREGEGVLRLAILWKSEQRERVEAAVWCAWSWDTAARLLELLAELKKRRERVLLLPLIWACRGVAKDGGSHWAAATREEMGVQWLLVGATAGGHCGEKDGTQLLLWREDAYVMLLVLLTKPEKEEEG
ncbi:hypothetical protein HHK36_018383 [Tetracentron sinense]|uniref:Short-chain dehydrogenase TIC 32, chloroplastic n=1 Tax=Tetracentron sinense TaxID=13715 RepID=A0A835DAA0_TETSI|nr:hypothetical protein HHK36_018383 [Tetracentron sinense]